MLYTYDITLTLTNAYNLKQNTRKISNGIYEINRKTLRK